MHDRTRSRYSLHCHRRWVARHVLQGGGGGDNVNVCAAAAFIHVDRRREYLWCCYARNVSPAFIELMRGQVDTNKTGNGHRPRNSGSGENPTATKPRKDGHH